MPTERLSMRDVREILRQKWQLGRSHRQVAESVGASAGAVGETMRRAKVARRNELGDGGGAASERAGGALVPVGGGGGEADAGLRVDPPRAPTRRRDLAAAAPRVRGAAARRVPLLAILRALPSVAAPAGRDDAPGAPGRRENRRRLLGKEAVHMGREDGRTDRGGAVCRRARRLELHVRGGDALAARA